MPPLSHGSYRRVMMVGSAEAESHIRDQHCAGYGPRGPARSSSSILQAGRTASTNLPRGAPSLVRLTRPPPSSSFVSQSLTSARLLLVRRCAMHRFPSHRRETVRPPSGPCRGRPRFVDKGFLLRGDPRIRVLRQRDRLRRCAAGTGLRDGRRLITSTAQLPDRTTLGTPKNNSNPEVRESQGPTFQLLTGFR